MSENNAVDNYWHVNPDKRQLGEDEMSSYTQIYYFNEYI